METIQRDLVESILDNFHKFSDKTYEEMTEELSKITKGYDIKLNNHQIDNEDLYNKIRLYLRAKESEGLVLKTLEDYELELHLFARFTPKKTHEVTSNDIREYMSNLDVKRSTLIKKLQVIKGFFMWLLDEEIISSNPAKRVKTPKKEIRVNTYFTIKELETLRESTTTLRQRAMLEFYYSTGIRLSEGIDVKIEDIDFNNLSLRVIGKGNKERVIYFNDKAAHHLDAYLNSRSDSCEYLFTTERKPIRKMGKNTVGDEFRKISDNANLGRSISAHDTRRSFASHAISRGVDILVIQHLLGHANLSTTEIYCELSDDRKEFEYRRLMSQ